MTYGIPRHTIPINEKTGELDLRPHHQWLRTMQKRELLEGVAEENEIIVPGQSDIIMGRGSRSRNSHAHLRFRSALEKHRSRYDTAERSQKMAVAHEVFIELMSAGCRFLKVAPLGMLEVCQAKEATSKISHAFRNMRILDRKKLRKSEPDDEEPDGEEMMRLRMEGSFHGV